MRNKIRSYIFLLVLLISCLYVPAQSDINSPYSAFGIGDLYGNRSAYYLSQGGISMGLSNSQYINFTNPASYHGFDSIAFVFEGGLIGDYVSARTAKATAHSQTMQLGYLLMGFPVTKWWNASIGLTPYSSLGYLIYDEQVLDNIGLVNYVYEGYGGLNQVYFGSSFTFFDKLSLGFNAAYLFGTLNYDKVVDFPDSLHVSSFRLGNNMVVHDFLFTLGLQYSGKLNDDISITIGGIFNNTTDLKATTDLLGVSYFVGNDNVDFVKDTVVFIQDETYKVRFPMGYGAGIAIEDTDHWLVGADYQFQRWSDFTSFGISDSLANSMRFSIGGYFKPQGSGIEKYWEKIQYRFGFRYQKTFLTLRNNQINEFGATFGVGLPLRGNKSTFNLAFEAGQGGTTNNGLIKESFFRFTLGIAIYERWFIKRKFY